MKKILVLATLVAAASILAGGCGNCDYRDDLSTDAAGAEANFKKFEALADKSFSCYASTSRVKLGPGTSPDSLQVAFPAEITADTVDKEIQATFEKNSFKLVKTKKQDNGVIIHTFQSGDERYVASIGRVGKQPTVELFHMKKP